MLRRVLNISLLGGLVAAFATISGTAHAAVELARRAGAEVVECAFIIELAFLGGAARLAPLATHSLLRYED